jgi:hypothetical protein
VPPILFELVSARMVSLDVRQGIEFQTRAKSLPCPPSAGASKNLDDL